MGKERFKILNVYYHTSGDSSNYAVIALAPEDCSSDIIRGFLEEEIKKEFEDGRIGIEPRLLSEGISPRLLSEIAFEDTGFEADHEGIIFSRYRAPVLKI
jgi:hypothetical protein